jgi:hypothetical protein
LIPILINAHTFLTHCLALTLLLNSCLQPFDERLLPEVAGAVLEAAIASDVARLTDIDVVAYKRQLADLNIRMAF